MIEIVIKMAQTETQPITDPKLDQKAEEAIRFYYTPRYQAWLKEDKYVVEVALPGVHKDQIKIKASKDLLTVQGRREDVQYDLDLEFYQDIESDKIKASYVEGLLKLELPIYNELEHAKDVHID
jgi:HSP20 family molecular chaperone IbpA